MSPREEGLDRPLVPLVRAKPLFEGEILFILNKRLLLLSLNLTAFLGSIIPLAPIGSLLPFLAPLANLVLTIWLVLCIGVRLIIVLLVLDPIKLRPTPLSIWPIPVVLLVNITTLVDPGPPPLWTIIHNSFSDPVLLVNLCSSLRGTAKNPTVCRLPNT